MKTTTSVAALVTLGALVGPASTCMRSLTTPRASNTVYALPSTFFNTGTAFSMSATSRGPDTLKIAYQ
jgi:hypothetical protein